MSEENIVVADTFANSSEEQTQPTVELIGIGSPLVDVLLDVEDAFLSKHVEGAKGGMELVSADIISGILEQTEVEPKRVPGGAASNTTVGCANLGISSAFIGCAGADDNAKYYSAALYAQGCEARLLTHESEPTGHVLSLVTPDAERTMRTCLGAAATLDPAHVTADMFAGARVVMLEGYTLFNHALTRAIADAAHEAGCKLALDFASFEVVAANKDIITELLDTRVDIVFANEDEATAWMGDSEEAAGGLKAALESLAARCEIAVVKMGADGALIAAGDERVTVEAVRAEAIDTTGAGDNWAAGFLAGYLRDLPLATCGNLAAQAGAAAVSVMGAVLPPDDWKRMRGYLEAWLPAGR